MLVYFEIMRLLAKKNELKNELPYKLPATNYQLLKKNEMKNGKLPY